MAKLTKAQRDDLRFVLRNAERAQAFIMADRVAVCTRKNMGTTTLDYTRASDGTALTEVNRDYGSDLTGLEAAIKALASFIVRN